MLHKFSIQYTVIKYTVLRLANERGVSEDSIDRIPLPMNFKSSQSIIFLISIRVKGGYYIYIYHRFIPDAPEGFADF